MLNLGTQNEIGKIQKFQQNAPIGRLVRAGIDEERLIDLQVAVPSMDIL